MEGASAVDAAVTSSDPHMDENDAISFHSDSSGDTKLQESLNEEFSDDQSKQISTPAHRRVPSDHREDVPNDSPSQTIKGKDRRRPRPTSLQEDLSPIPYSWYYNPYSQTDYSPSVSLVTPRKTISSWMTSMMRSPQEPEETENDTDGDSIDSVEQLEQVAAQIRSELRQSELQELADEAESAAEAGQESFAGRASTFGDSSHSLGYTELNDLNPKQQYKLKRYKTYSEGTSLLRHAALRPVQRSRPKIRCLQLRDINEVIPTFKELHSHLKKHLVLSGVEEQSLEIDFTVAEKEDSRARSRKGRRTPVQFLNSLKSWVSTNSTRSRSSAPQSPSTDVASDVTTPRQKTPLRSNKPVLDLLKADTAADESSTSTFASHSSKEDTYEVGGRLSGHLHAPKAVTRSSIRVPTGLELPDDLGIPYEIPSKVLLHHDADRTDGDTVDTVPTSSSSQQGETNQDERGSPRSDLEELEPIALFQHINDDASSAGGGQSAGTGSSSNSMQPISPKSNAGERLAGSVGPNMFITPMRLRGIRRDSRRLAFDRSLSHKSADLGWTLKVHKQRRQTCADSNLPADDDRLNLPLLSVKSDGDYSPLLPLNPSKDASVISLPEDISFVRRDEMSLSLSGPSLVADDKRELSQVVESKGSMVAELDRPKSLSFDEHDVVGLAVQGFSKSLNDLQDINTKVTVEDNLFDSCLDNDSRNAIALPPNLSNGDLSDIVVKCNGFNGAIAAPVSKDALDTKGKVGDLANVAKGVSGTPTETPSLDVSLPLMPTLDKMDEQQPAKDTDGNSGTEIDKKLQVPPEHVSIPWIEQRSICMNDISAVLEAEADDVSLHSLEMSNLFSSEAEAEDSCVMKGATNGDALKSTEEHDKVFSRRMELSDPISEFYAQEEALDMMIGATKESSLCEEIRPSDPVSEFYANELAFDAVVATRSSKDDDEGEIENGQEYKTEEIEFPQVSHKNIEERADFRDAEEQVTALGELSIEVNALNESSSDIVSHCQQIVESEHSTSRYLKREEILKSQSGRVKVTIELSLHDDDTDDDDVRSEGSSVHTPQVHPCECLINAATHIEENVRGDLAKAGECARIKYGLHAHEEETKVESTLPQVSAPTPEMTASPPRESAVNSSMIVEGQNQQSWSPMRRTHSCPSILNLAEEQVDTSMISSATMPNRGLARAQRKSSKTSHWELSERRDYFRTSSMLDPCQSTSPFKETMGDMMKSFSPMPEFEKERNAMLQAQENHEYLSNYMYSSKPVGEVNTDTIEANMCGDHCGYLSDVLDSYRSFIPTRSTNNKDMLSLNARDKSYLSSAGSETWFDIASEHFDGALEKIMGRAHAQSRRWNSMFQAPGLKSKRDIENASTSRNKGRKGIVLVKQSSEVDSRVYNGQVSEQQFESLYGIPRKEFEQLPVTERSILHDKVHRSLQRRTIRTPLQVGLEPPSPAISTRSLSSSDLAMTGDVRI